jgi:hypothetical protein
MPRIKPLILVVGMLCLMGRVGSAFNLWTDIQQNTQWTLGQNAAGGTALNLRNGQFDGSALAQVATYRFLSLWGGGTFIPQSDQTIKAIDTVKVGLNLNYFLTGFANKPPEVLQRIVIGPSFAMPLFTTPRVGIPFLDINYAFGNLGTVPLPPAQTLAPPPSTGMLNLLRPVALADILNRPA